MKYLLTTWVLLLTALPVMAQTGQTKLMETDQQFGDYRVHFNVFNSTFVPAEVARIHQLVRAKDRVLVNISVTHHRDGITSLGLPAHVTGTATNLIQQQRPLDFVTISEGEATYYLASLRHTNEELMHFVVNVQPEGEASPFTVRFNRTLYIDK